MRDSERVFVRLDPLAKASLEVIGGEGTSAALRRLIPLYTSSTIDEDTLRKMGMSKNPSTKESVNLPVVLVQMMSAHGPSKSVWIRAAIRFYTLLDSRLRMESAYSAHGGSLQPEFLSNAYLKLFLRTGGKSVDDSVITVLESVQGQLQALQSEISELKELRRYTEFGLLHDTRPPTPNEIDAMDLKSVLMVAKVWGIHTSLEDLTMRQVKILVQKQFGYLL